MRAKVAMEFTCDKYSAPTAIEKMKILEAILELQSAKHHCQSSPFTNKTGPNWSNQQCCLAGSSKKAPRIFIFSIALSAKYLVILWEIHCCLCPHIFGVYYFSLSHCEVCKYKIKEGHVYVKEWKKQWNVSM